MVIPRHVATISDLESGYTIGSVRRDCTGDASALRTCLIGSRIAERPAVPVATARFIAIADADG